MNPLAQLRTLPFSSKTLLVFIFLLTVALKLHTDYAPASQLRWILAPVTVLVEAQSGIPFHFDPVEGYMNPEESISIGRTCAGVNFIIIAWLMGFTLAWPQQRDFRQRLRAWLLHGVCAYVLAVAVNAFRIVAAIGALNGSAHLEWLGKHKTHEALGIFIYFSFLLAYYFALRYFLKRHAAHANPA